MIQDNFKLLGFTENEVNVYLALAEVGKSTASLIAKRVGIARTTTYSVLDSLVIKGLISTEQQATTSYYVVNKASALLRLIDHEQQELNAKGKIAQQLVKLIEPYFRSNHYSVPKIQFHEGRAGVESMLYELSPAFKESLLEHGDIWWGYQDHTFVQHYRNWLDYHWQNVRSETEIVQLISNDVDLEQELRGKIERREIRPIPGEYDFSSTIWVVGDYVVLIMSRNDPHYAFVLNDPVFGSNLRLLFKLLWETATVPLD